VPRTLFSSVSLTYCMIYLRGCFVRRIPSANRVFAFEFLQLNWVPHKIYALLLPGVSPLPPHNMSSPHMHIFWHLSCRICDFLSWQPWDRPHNAARRTWNIKLRLAIMVLLLFLHHIFCQHLLLLCIFSYIFLVFVHACHYTEEFSFNIVTCAFHIISIHDISSLVFPVFPP